MTALKEPETPQQEVKKSFKKERFTPVQPIKKAKAVTARGEKRSSIANYMTF